MKSEMIDLRGQMRILTTLLERESIEPPANETDALITREARSIVEGLAVQMLHERSGTLRHSEVCSDDYLELNYPEIIANLVNGLGNEGLSEYLQDFWDYLLDCLPRTSKNWTYHFRSDYLYYTPLPYTPPRKRTAITLAEFEQFLNELHRKEGEYIEDTLRLIEQFKCNRVS